MFQINRMSQRLRDNRKTEEIRSSVRETHLAISDFIYPLFIEEGNNIKKEIVSIPKNTMHDYLSWNEWIERGVKRDVEEITKGYEELDNAIQRGLSLDLEILSKGAQEVQEIGRKAMQVTKQGSRNLINGAKEVKDTLVKGYTSLNKVGEEVVQGAFNGVKMIAQENIITPIETLVSNGKDRLLSPKEVSQDVVIVPDEKVLKDFVQLKEEFEQIKTLGGIPGPQGPQGIRGNPGPQGPRGVDGLQGVAGAQGGAF